MALAKRCDRCGKFYEWYRASSTENEHIKSEFIEDQYDDSLVCGGANAIVLCKNSHVGDRIKNIATIDLCPECLRAFDTFINPFKQEVNDNG